MSTPASRSGGDEAGKPVGGQFGVDAPAVPIVFAVAVVVLVVVGVVLTGTVGIVPAIPVWALALYAAFSVGSYLYTTLRGKFVCWSELLDEAKLRGDEHAVDLGCGRGAVLISLAKRLTRGQISGIDLWRSRDQSGNDIEATKRNARACGVEDRVELNTGDITKLPYHDAQFDLVVSSLVIHNIKAREGRRRAIAEAVRVLQPGGRLIIADISHTRDYASWLTEEGMSGVRLRNWGVRGWWGGPWLTTSAVVAQRPA